MSILRDETFADNALVGREEIERFDPSTVEYRRYDGSLVIQEQRSATPDEIEAVDEYDAGVVIDEKRSNVDQAVAALRQWAADAQSTTVTNANQRAVLQTTINRLGTFFDRFADLIETR